MHRLSEVAGLSDLPAGLKQSPASSGWGRAMRCNIRVHSRHRDREDKEVALESVMLASGAEAGSSGTALGV